MAPNGHIFMSSPIRRGSFTSLRLLEWNDMTQANFYSQDHSPLFPAILPSWHCYFQPNWESSNCQRDFFCNSSGILINIEPNQERGDFEKYLASFQMIDFRSIFFQILLKNRQEGREIRQNGTKCFLAYMGAKNLLLTIRFHKKRKK